MAEANVTRELEALAAEIGDRVYMDVAKWHLYLSDAHLHTAVAEQVYPLLQERAISEDAVLAVLREISVPLGGGRSQLALAELVPAACQTDLVEFLTERQRDF